MTPWDDLLDEMRRLPLDPDTADRLLSGNMEPDDAPPGYADVARLLRAAATWATPGELAAEREVVALVARRMGSSPAPARVVPRPGRSFARRTRGRLKVGAVVVAGFLMATTGLAMAGALPGAAQNIASEVLQRIGISVPRSDSPSGVHPGNSGQSSGGESNAPAAPPGAHISQIAKTTTAIGVDKGAEISTAASGGRSRASQKGTASSRPSSTHGSALSQIAKTTTAIGVDKGAEISTAASGGKSQTGQHGKANGGSNQSGHSGGSGGPPATAGSKAKGGSGGTSTHAHEGHAGAGAGKVARRHEH